MYEIAVGINVHIARMVGIAAYASHACLDKEAVQDVFLAMFGSLGSVLKILGLASL
jgi:hypothetical protein